MEKVNPSEPTGQQQPWSFCETPEEKCTMNYCDDNGCMNRKRHLVEPSNKAPESHSPNGLTKEDKKRIWTQAEEHDKNLIDTYNWSGDMAQSFMDGAEYATLYEREQSAQLRAEVERLQKSLDTEIKSWEKVVNYINDGSGYDDEGNWIPDIVLRRLKDYDKIKD